MEHGTTIVSVECNQNFVSFLVLHLQHEAHQNVATDYLAEETPVLTRFCGGKVRIVYVVLGGEIEECREGMRIIEVGGGERHHW